MAEHSEEKIPMTLDLAAAPSLRERIARALYNEGASCGECRSYSGWDSCDECRRHVLDLADEVLAVLADADPTDLGLERVGVATEAGIASGSDFVVTPRESPGDVPLYRLGRDTEADRG